MQGGKLRPMANQTVATTLRADKKAAEALLLKGKIRVGLIHCRIEKRVSLNKCNKCWSYDHDTQACKGPDRRGRCLRCGVDGHMAKDCGNDEACPFCEKKGHRADSSKCPLFRKALNIARKREREKTAAEKAKNKNDCDINRTTNLNTGY